MSAIRTWWREVTREARYALTTGNRVICCYCGHLLCIAVPGLDLEQVARAHYGREWRKHAEITTWRGAL